MQLILEGISHVHALLRDKIMLQVIFTFVLLQLQVHAQLQPGCILSRNYDDDIATCDNQNLQEIPSDLPSNITILSFSFNQLTKLEDQLLTNDCGLNHNTSIWCSRFPSLNYLDFSYNDIGTISRYSLFGMVNLLGVYLANNKLENLPMHVFYSNQFLAFIDVSGNNINFIHPKAFVNLKHLQVLLISNNHIVDLHPETFDGLVNLLTLWLNNNAILSLSHDLFKNLGNLKALKIDHNRLKCIPREILEQLPLLETFIASHNQIAFLNEAIFSNNAYLQTVDVSHNLVQALSKYTFLDLIKMHRVDFSFNRIKWLYLSYLPVSFKSNNKTKILVTDTDLCLDDIGAKNPCFSSWGNFLQGNEIFHSLDFSYNNIRKIKYSDTKSAHTLELANISLAGNYGLEIKVKFLKKERFVIRLNLDGTNLNWKNLTLINEIWDLPYFKILSVVGCGICEYHTQQLLTSIFNPNMQVNVICQLPMNENLLTHTGMPKNTSGSYIFEDTSDMGTITSTVNGKCLEDKASYNANSLCSLECECYVNANITIQLINWFKYPCAYTLDCSYYSFTVLPHIESNFSCILFSHNNLKRIEAENFLFSHETRLLDLSFNCLNYLPDKVFNSFTNLESLLLDNNNLTSLKSGIFKHLTKLITVTLHGNSISSYDACIFAESPRLFSISLDFANLDRLHDVTFQNLSQLQILKVHDNTIKAGHKNIVTKEFFKNLCAVKTLSVVGFNLSEILNGTDLCSKSLQALKLKCNYLPILTDIFMGLGDIERVELPDNNIQNLGHNAFRNLTKVTIIDLSYNSIMVLHSSVFSDMQKLIHLNVSHNKISCISAIMFQNLSMLSILDLSYNSIAWIDSNTFSILSYLSDLLLNNNNISNGETHSLNKYKNTCVYVDRLETIPELNLNLTQRKHNIQSINLSNNAFEIIDKTMFGKNQFLREITASYNRIHQINNDTFKYTRELESLKLDNNELVVITRSIFKNLTHLTFLTLHRNHLEFVEHSAFLDLKALQYLILSHNRLQTFDLTSLPVGGPLKLISLHNNSIVISNLSSLKLEFLETLYLFDNPLTNVIVDDLFSVPSLVNLQLQNTSIQEFSTEAFNNNQLQILNLSQSCVHSLAGRHFHGLPRLLLLDISAPRTEGCALGTNNVLSWKNITLINNWFEHPYLQYLILAGHEICDEQLWNQVIDNIFLFETWKIVSCATVLPTSILSPDGREFITFGLFDW
ncbi:slit homolog 1 protein-like [Bacillus rossius redtenbacheri]|uniref:slit homolog 1 protein-like n=1 Tax=Bacillus rossius redtenbacheri TaxID=93214 RepID=UPI002FDC9843